MRRSSPSKRDLFTPKGDNEHSGLVLADHAKARPALKPLLLRGRPQEYARVGRGFVAFPSGCGLGFLKQRPCLVSLKPKKSQVERPTAPVGPRNQHLRPECTRKGFSAALIILKQTSFNSVKVAAGRWFLGRSTRWKGQEAFGHLLRPRP